MPASAKGWKDLAKSWLLVGIGRANFCRLGADKKYFPQLT
jgi:hypothetical protein